MGKAPGMSTRLNALGRPAAIAFTVLAGLAGCSDSPASPSGSSLTGSWRVAATESAGDLLSCELSGTANLTQQGDTFHGTLHGTVSCALSGLPGTVDTPVDMVLNDGVINGSAVSFTDESDCLYSGTVSGTPQDHMAGTIECPANGSDIPITGTWEMTR